MLSQAHLQSHHFDQWATCPLNDNCQPAWRTDVLIAHIFIATSYDRFATSHTFSVSDQKT